MKKVILFTTITLVIIMALTMLIGAADADTAAPVVEKESIVDKVFTGNNIAIIGAAIVAGIAGMGSAKAVSSVGNAASAVLAEEPSLFGKLFVLQALPMTQGVYGLVSALLILIKAGILTGGADLTVAQGFYLLVAALPYTFVGYFSAIWQSKAAIAGVNLVGKRPDQLGKAITSTALVETYAIFGLLVSILAIIRF